MNPNITVLDGHTLNPGDNPWTEIDKFGRLTVHARTSPNEIFDRAKDADILLTNKTKIGRELIARLPRLKFISVLATGYNVVDVAAAAERGIPVSNVPDYGTEAVAQHVLALLLELVNHVGRQARSVAAGDWSACPDFCYWDKPIVELGGLTLGIVGLGRVGFRVAELGHAFGMKICYTGSVKEPRGFPIHHRTIQQLFSEADVVSLHCPQTADNLEFINANLIRSMKPSAFLINTARGTLIREADLAEALCNNVIAGAALDVLSTEPPASTNPLLNCPGCLVTPHVAWSGVAARRRLMKTTVDNIATFLAGSPVNRVN
jgi:glycerate dehydrogenase